MKTFIVTLVFCASITAAFAQPQHPLQPPRSVNVEGAAERRIVPDKAIIELGVETEGKDATEVKADNDKRMRSILASLQRIGIPEADIQTSMLQLNPQYSWDPNGKREFLKYVMTNKVTVTLKNLAKVQDVISKSIEQGGNTLGDISFVASNSTAIQDSLRIEAAKNAKKKASDLATAVGAKVGKPLSITEQNSYQPPVPMYRAMKAMDSGAESTSTVSAGEILIRVTVSASFELE